MATFTTKFNVGDVAYYINEANITLLTGTIGSILVRQDLSRGSSALPKIQYLLREKPIPIDEILLLTPIEAKNQMDILLVKRQSEINLL